VKTSPFQQTLLYLILAVMVVCALFPIYWMLNTSLKLPQEVYNIAPTYFPKRVVFTAYQQLVDKFQFLVNIKNSVIVSVVVSVFSILVSMLAAYAISKLQFKGRGMISKLILYAYLMPHAVLFIPLYIFVTTMGLSNSIWGLIVIYPTITIPYATWMLISYFGSIPVAIEEAAMIDGCSRLEAMVKIVFPLAAPGIAATAIFAFTLCWSEYLYALVVISDSAQKTVTLGLSDMVVGDVFSWGPLMGGSIVASIPVVIMYLVSSRYLVGGMTLGSVK